MKSVIIFAYACDPARGSEPGAGFAIAQQAVAVMDDVIVITRREGAGSGSTQTASELGTEATVRTVWSPTFGPTYFRYLCWVVGAARTAARIRRDRNISVLHHATYASDWFINPLHLLRKADDERWVWGPAGGASYPPRGLAAAMLGTELGAERLRSFSTGTMRKLFQRLLRSRVDYAIALNTDSARAFRDAGYPTVAVSSNFVVNYDDLPKRIADPARPTLLWASRGEKWKGISVALEVFAKLPDSWTFVILGANTDTPALRELVADKADQVRFEGVVPRDVVLQEISAASVLILPSLHDSAPWIAGEAAGVGTPVVCLDLGGVPAMAGSCAVAVDPEPVKSLVRRLREAVETAGHAMPEPFRKHTAAELQSSLALAYGASTS